MIIPYGTVDLDATTSHAMEWRLQAELYPKPVGKHDTALTGRVCDSDPPRSANTSIWTRPPPLSHLGSNPCLVTLAIISHSRARRVLHVDLVVTDGGDDTFRYPR